MSTKEKQVSKPRPLFAGAREALRSSQSLKAKTLVVSCMAFIMPISASSYFGNILIYLYTYYHAHQSDIYIDSLWILTTYRVLVPLGMLTSSFVGRSIGNFRAVALFVTLKVTGAFISFYTIVNPIALLVTFGALQGFCAGCLYNLSWKICDSGIGTHSALSKGVMASGSSLGALVITGLSFLVVNPHNEPSDASDGGMRYFTNPAIVERVPYFFIMLGAFGSFILYGGLALLYISQRIKPAESVNEGGVEGKEEKETLHIANGEEEDTLSQSDSELTNCNKRARDKPEYGTLERKNGCHSQPSTIQRGSDERSGVSRRVPQPQNESKTPVLQHGQRKDSEPTGNGCHKSNASTYGLSPNEVLRTQSFWVLWILHFLLSITMFIHSSLFKEFGESYLHNDALLTITGVLGLFSMMITRPFNGIFVDRMGSRAGLLLTGGLSAIFINLMMVSLYIYPPMYVLWVVCAFSSVTTVYTQFHYSVREMYGPAYYSTNVALVFTASIPVSILLPAIVPYLVATLGWMYMFLIAAACAFVSFALSWTMPARGMVKL
ncbi:uncharacterized protein LOC101849685 [Aplysia californica]|uniref:Uncharacterized protein LOC101849685 n=1 Tax=Aplysia californica TaxID=6500 RepID=A0ABM0JKT4_APLCA|nr:uncharacterized protein LOC101849685 [Aplysia californica]